jgi:hypothetical protein
MSFYTSIPPITEAAWSKARTFFANSNTGIVGSNPTRGMDVCVRLFCVQVEALRRADPPSKESYRLYIFFLWLYNPILDLGRLHETFRFISVTRSRTVSSTTWTAEQLVARTLLTAPGDCDDDEVGGMNGFGMGNQSTQREPAPTPFCPPQIPLAGPGGEPGPPRWEASD